MESCDYPVWALVARPHLWSLGTLGDIHCVIFLIPLGPKGADPKVWSLLEIPGALGDRAVPLHLESCWEAGRQGEVRFGAMNLKTSNF